MQTDETMKNVAEIPTDDIANMGDYKANSLWRLTLRRLLRQRSAQIGLVVLGRGLRTIHFCGSG